MIIATKVSLFHRTCLVYLYGTGFILELLRKIIKHSLSDKLLFLFYWMSSNERFWSHSSTWNSAQHKNSILFQICITILILPIKKNKKNFNSQDRVDIIVFHFDLYTSIPSVCAYGILIFQIVLIFWECDSQNNFLMKSCCSHGCDWAENSGSTEWVSLTTPRGIWARETEWNRFIFF